MPIYLPTTAKGMEITETDVLIIIQFDNWCVDGFQIYVN